MPEPSQQSSHSYPITTPQKSSAGQWTTSTQNTGIDTMHNQASPCSPPRQAIMRYAAQMLRGRASSILVLVLGVILLGPGIASAATSSLPLASAFNPPSATKAVDLLVRLATLITALAALVGAALLFRLTAFNTFVDHRKNAMRDAILRQIFSRGVPPNPQQIASVVILSHQLGKYEKDKELDEALTAYFCAWGFKTYVDEVKAMRNRYRWLGARVTLVLGLALAVLSVTAATVVLASSSLVWAGVAALICAALTVAVVRLLRISLDLRMSDSLSADKKQELLLHLTTAPGPPLK